MYLDALREAEPLIYAAINAAALGPATQFASSNTVRSSSAPATTPD